MRRWLVRAAVAAVVLVLVIQVVPYGRSHAQAPITGEPAWDSPTTRQLAVRACFDCHSNETNWPWYSNIAPVSWWIQNHVDEGRAALNFSEWDRSREGGEDAAETVLRDSMPPDYYKLTHPSARLSDADKALLVAGLQATLGGEGRGGGGRGGSGGGDD